MVEDLKKQASQIYREESEKERVRTSDSLSMKRLLYLAIGLAVLFLVVLQIFGGFRNGRSSEGAAVTPPPLLKEAPPPELLSPQASPPPTFPDPAAQTSNAAPRTATEPAVASSPAVEVKPAAEKAKSAPAPKPPAPKPAAKAKEVAEPAPPAPPLIPEIAPEEKARRERAREAVIQSKPSLAQLLLSARSQDWQAIPISDEVYQVTFNIPDQAGGPPVQYIWKVDLKAMSITPLSYHARRLP